MVALVSDAELPPKIAVHPRPEGSFGHAMPAHLRAPIRTGPTTSSGSSGSRASRRTGPAGCRPSTGSCCSSTRSTAGRSRSSTRGRSPRSGRRPCPASRSPGSAPDRRSLPRAALIGAGVQGRSHLAGAGRRAARRPPLGLRPPSGSGGRPGRCGPGDGRCRRRHPGRLRPRGRRGRRRRRHRSVVRAGPPGDDVRLAGRRRARRAGRLRDVLRGGGRRRGVAVPRRPTRAVPREPRRRPVRGLPGSGRDDRRGHPGRHGAAGHGRVVVSHLGVGLATSCSAMRSSGGPSSAASGPSCRPDATPRRRADCRTARTWEG